MNQLSFILCVIISFIMNNSKAQFELHELFQHAAMTSRVLEQLEEGEIVMANLKTDLENEIAVAGAVLITQPISAVSKLFKQNEDINLSDTIIQHHFLSPSDSIRENFADLKIFDEHKEELATLLNVEAGIDFNFSQYEILKFQELREKIPLTDTTSSEFARPVLDLLRQILMNRFQDYVLKGVSGISPYQRADGKSFPSRELQNALKHESIIKNFDNVFYDSILNYPEKQDLLVSSYYWLKQYTNNRPNIALVHRMYPKDFDSNFVLLERQFNVHHSYNCNQFVVYLVPHQENTVVFYLNYTYTDIINGFGSSIAKGFAESQLNSETKNQLRVLQNELNGTD